LSVDEVQVGDSRLVRFAHRLSMRWVSNDHETDVEPMAIVASGDDGVKGIWGLSSLGQCTLGEGTSKAMRLNQATLSNDASCHLHATVLRMSLRSR